MSRKLKRLLLGAPALSLFFASPALATIPYTPVALPPGAFPAVGPGVIPPHLVFGKEYSHDIDLNVIPVPDPEQVIAWDGLGGVADGIDYSGSRGPNFPADREVDALGNSGDALYGELIRFTDRGLLFPDRAHLVFSIDDTIARYVPVAGGPPLLEKPSSVPLIPFTGPVMLTNGNVIGGSGDISIELAGAFHPPSTQTIWAPAPSVNGMPLPRDVDGLELWGPEPGITADSDKYSLDVDSIDGVGVSVFSYDLVGGASVPYISQAAVIAAVTSLLGPIPPTAMDSHGATFLAGQELINLDALMVQDIIGSSMSFDRDPAGGIFPSDSILFSIRQIPDMADPDGYYATGSEIFWMTASGAEGFLLHGGHAWDHAYALSDLGIKTPDGSLAYIDINALEAIGEVVVPEPSTFVLLGLGAVAGLVWRRNARRS